MSAFDAKINNENMTKCLQSLKEMYQDLAMRQVYCPMEAEFRQYNVLLKLNDGDILRSVRGSTNGDTLSGNVIGLVLLNLRFVLHVSRRVCLHLLQEITSRPCPHSDVQQFRDEVRNSPEVKLAVQAFTAVNSNNFVRFFKLVKGASYLASCLLHRYFNQVGNGFLH